MIIRSNRITINRIRKPEADNVNDELLWFFDSLGILGNRDKDKSCFRTVIILLRSVNRDGMTSDEISEKINLSRGTVVHHLNNLMKSGVVINQSNKYMLRVDNLSNLVEE
ncbi:MAG: winged helix-turn-helix domain-containing protein, partial [Nanoarchaeota archaeon]